MSRFILALVIIASLMASCGGGQKPSERNRSRDEQAVDSLDGVRVAFTRLSSNATPEINVELNGVPFRMLWDTGAMGTCISTLEFVNLSKAGKISNSDLVGQTYVTVADGSTMAVPEYVIKELVIKGTKGEILPVYNVTVTVMDNIGASMLLGQNVMKELPQYTFDDSENEIVFRK